MVFKALGKALPMVGRAIGSVVSSQRATLLDMQTWDATAAALAVEMNRKTQHPSTEQFPITSPGLLVNQVAPVLVPSLLQGTTQKSQQKSMVSALLSTGIEIAPKSQQDKKEKDKEKQRKKSLYTVEFRDWWQSSAEGVMDMSANGDAMRYISTVNKLYHAGAPIKSIVAFGGTWYQLFAMNDINPFDVFRNVIDATPAQPGQEALPIELLQRSSHQFGLEEVNQDVIRETYRKLAEIAGPDRKIIIRLFHFNNRDMQKDSTYEAIKELREQGIRNFVISDEHSYAVFMKNEEVAEGIVNGMLRNIEMTSGDVSYEIQGGIKDFSGSLAPQDAEVILRYADRRINEEADKLVLQGNAVDAERLRKATITLHSHLTDRSQHTADNFERVGTELGRAITTHRIHNVENATHHVIGEEGLTAEQLVLQRQAEGILAKIVRDNNPKVVKDYVPGQPRAWTGFAGGGTPMIQGFITSIAMQKKYAEEQKKAQAEGRKSNQLQPKDITNSEKEEAKKLLYRHMEAVRDCNNIPTVTPAQKGVADIASVRIANEKVGRPLYEGTFTSEAVDVVRNLHPETTQDKDMLETAFRQYRAEVVNRYEETKDISPELRAALLNVGMNSDKSSLDKEKTQAVIVEFAAKGEKLHPLVQDEIIEACGAATRPTRFPDQIANARKLVAELQAKNATLKVPEDEAVLLVATLRGRGIGRQAALKEQEETVIVIGVNPAKLWEANVAGDVLPEVMERRPVPEVGNAQHVETVKEAPQRKVG